MFEKTIKSLKEANKKLKTDSEEIYNQKEELNRMVDALNTKIARLEGSPEKGKQDVHEIEERLELEKQIKALQSQLVDSEIVKEL